MHGYEAAIKALLEKYAARIDEIAARYAERRNAIRHLCFQQRRISRIRAQERAARKRARAAYDKAVDKADSIAQDAKDALDDRDPYVREDFN
jgi:uncharacterized membrane-anchored protein